MSPAIWSRIARVSCLILATGMMSGCASLPSEPAPPAPGMTAPLVEPEPGPEESLAEPIAIEEDHYVHQVRWPGETLALIARWYTGRPQNWRAIAAANPSLDPQRLMLGDHLVIPTALLKTRSPMPEGYVRKSAPQRPAAPPPAKPAAAAPKPEDLEPAATFQPAAELDAPELFELPAPEPSGPEPDKAELFGPVD